MAENNQNKEKIKIDDIVKPDEIIEKYGKQYAKYDTLYKDYKPVNPRKHPNQNDYMFTKYHKFSSYYGSEHGQTTEVIEYYTDDSSHLNNYLRHKRYLERGEKNKEEFGKAFKKFSKEDFIEFDAITKELNKNLQPLTQNMMLYSGQDEEFYHDLKRGNILKWDSFISTSLDSTVPERFKGENNQALFIIYADENDYFIPALARSKYPDECEFILPPDTEVEILNVIKEESSNDVTYECRILTKY